MDPAPSPWADRPRFRQDNLVAEAIEDSGQRYVDVLDPDSGNLYRFYEVEFSLACGMDGERDIAGLVRWAQDELGLAPSPAEIRSVIATLGELGYLDGRGAPVAARPDDLAAGVVVGNRRPDPGARSNIELGHAGTTSQRGDMPKAPDVALGAAGSVPQKRVVTPVEDVPLGAPGRGAEQRRTPRPQPAVQPPPDVSLDLADQMSVKPDDVKEAVRASKVMKAVDVPPELRDALDERTTPSARAVSDFDVEQKTVPRQPTPLPARPAERPAHELRRPMERAPVQHTPTPVAERDRPVQPTAPGTSWSTVILAAALILVIGALASFLAWKYLIKKSNEDATGDKTSDQLPPKQPTEPTPPPQPPAPPPVMFASEAVPAAEIKPVLGGTLELIAPQGPVKKGDVLARFGGHERIERVIAENQTAIDRRVAPDVAMFEKRVEAVRASNRPANEIKAAEDLLEGRKHDLELRQKTIAAKQADLDKLIIKAPSDGDFTPSAKAGARVSTTDALGSFTPAPALVATFKPEGVPPAVDSAVYVAVKGNEATKLVCKVKSVDGAGLKVTCPGDPALVGKEVTYGGPAPSDAPIEMPPEAPKTPTETPKTPTEAPKAPVESPKAPQPKAPPAAPPQPKEGSGATPPADTGSAGGSGAG